MRSYGTFRKRKATWHWTDNSSTAKESETRLRTRRLVLSFVLRTYSEGRRPDSHRP